MVPIEAILSYIATSQNPAKSLITTLACRVAISSWLPATPSKMESFEDYSNTHRCLTGLRMQPE